MKDIHERIETYINEFRLEEGGPLQCEYSNLARQNMYWGTWYGRKLVMVEVDSEDSISVAFSLDFASYEVARFCRDLDVVGEWTPIETFFMVVGDQSDDTERFIQGDRATMYRAFRDCGLLEGGKQ